jgi:O-antigen/teichoic acid export membrane protein
VRKTNRASAGDDRGLRRRLSFGGASSFGGKAVAVVATLASNALLARLLSPHELGVYFIASSIVLFGSQLGALGLERVAVRFVAESLGLEEFAVTRRIISLVFKLGVLSSLCAALLYLGLGQVLGRTVFSSPELAAVTGLIAGWLALMALSRLFIETFRGFQEFLVASLLDGAIPGVLLCTCLGLLWSLDRRASSLSTVVALTIACVLASIIFATWRLYGKTRRLPQQTVQPNKEQFRLSIGSVLRVALPLWVTNLIVFATLEQAYPHLWILGAYRQPSEVALYGAAMKLMLIVSMPSIIVSSVLAPLIAEMYAQGRREKLESVLRTTTALVAVPAFLVTLAFALFGGPVLGLIFGSEYRAGALILTLLSVGQLGIVLAGPCVTTLMMTGHQTRMMLVASASAVVAVVVSVKVAGQYGATGVAMVASTGMVLQSVLMWLTTKAATGLWTHASFRRLSSLTRKEK